MTTSTVQQFYIGLLADPEASSELQGRVFAYASKRKIIPVLVALANHPHLDPVLDEALGEFPDAAVKAAWARRFDRSAEVLETLARKDNRASVLEGVAMVETLSADAYMRIAKRRHIKAHWALLQNPAVPVDVKEVAAAQVGEKYTGDGYRASQRLEQAFESQPELLPALASKTSSFAVIQVAAGSEELPAETQERIAEVFDEQCAEIRKSASSGSVNYSYQVMSELDKVVDAAAVVVANESFAQGHVDRVIKAVNASMHNTQRPSSRVFANAVAGRGKQTGPSTPKVSLGAARKASTRAELLGFAKQVSVHKNTSLAMAVLLNPLVDAEIASLAAGALNWTVGPRVLLAKLRDRPVAVAIMVENPALLTDETLAKMEDPRGVLQDVTLQLVRKGRRIPMSVSQSRFVTPSTAIHMPVDTFASADLPLATRKAAADAVMRTLATSDERWEIFESVGESYQGSLAELLSACGMLDGSLDEEPVQVPAELEPQVVSKSSVAAASSPRKVSVSAPVALPAPEVGASEQMFLL